MQKLIEPSPGEWTQGQFASLRGCGIAVYASSMAEHEENNAPVCVMAPGSSGNDFDMANAKVIAQAKNLQQLVREFLQSHPVLTVISTEMRARAQGILKNSEHYVEVKDEPNDTAVAG